jgi:hypothetical protein
MESKAVIMHRPFVPALRQSLRRVMTQLHFPVEDSMVKFIDEVGEAAASCPSQMQRLGEKH